MAIDAVERFGEVVKDNPELKNNPALAPLRKALLKEPQAFFAKLRDQLQASRDTAATSLMRLADASLGLGLLTDEIGDKEDALRAFQESLALRERLANNTPQRPDLVLPVVQTLIKIGNLQVMTSRPIEAMASYERARSKAESLVRADPSRVDFHDALASVNLRIGVLHGGTGRQTEALAALEQERGRYERLVAEDPANKAFPIALADALNKLATLRAEMGQLVEAMAAFTKASMISDRLVAEQPENLEVLAQSASLVFQIGQAELRMGRWTEALARYGKAYEVYERLVQANPSNTAFLGELANVQRNIGRTQVSMRNLSQAMASLRPLGRVVRATRWRRPDQHRVPPGAGHQLPRYRPGPESARAESRGDGLAQTVSRDSGTSGSRQPDDDPISERGARKFRSDWRTPPQRRSDRRGDGDL